jgi:hypothetical protein
MAQCGACGSTVLFGGAKVGDAKFCNAKCAQRGQLLLISQQLPRELVMTKTAEVFRGACPKCQGSEPVDLYLSYRVFSLVLLTQWQTRTHVSCRGCARKAQAGDLIFSLFLGWWGFPWGFIITPVQIARNIGAMTKAESVAPSPGLEKAIRISLASSVATAPR